MNPEALEMGLDRRADRKRAKQIWWDALTRRQRRSFTKKGQVIVRGSSGGVWRIVCSGSRTGNLYAWMSPGVWWRCCFVPLDDALPFEDFLLSQLILIKYDEPTAFRIGVPLPGRHRQW